mgnify:CR=1 FL=1
MIVLGIETSCDETATAVCRSGSIISSHIRSQAIHEKYGGVIPEIASREHERYLNNMVSDTLKDAGISKEELEGIAVTQGPGLSGTLITGVCFAKGLSLGMGLPIIGVNHLEAHIFANFLADPTLEFPFVCLLVSGGHTQLWYVKNINNYQLMGESRDDAAGEAFDKGARILGLAYPGGPEIEKLSKGGNPNAVKFPRAMMKKADIEIFFSRLQAADPEPKGELDYINPFTLLVAVVLSAQATDVGVNRATGPLFDVADTPEKMLALGEAKIRDHIKTIGLFNNKAKNVFALSRRLIEHHNSVVPEDRETLETLPGVGRKTANVVLNIAFGHPTIAVDTHLFRLGNRTGLAPGKTPLAVEKRLEKRIPDAYKRHAHHWLILHGRYVCKARKPDCGACIVRDVCGYKAKLS